MSRPNVAALLNQIRDRGTAFSDIAFGMWIEYRISHEATQRAIKHAEAAGLVTVTRPNRARASTWTVVLRGQEHPS